MKASFRIIRRSVPVRLTSVVHTLSPPNNCPRCARFQTPSRLGNGLYDRERGSNRRGVGEPWAGGEWCILPMLLGQSRSLVLLLVAVLSWSPEASVVYCGGGGHCYAAVANKYCPCKIHERGCHRPFGVATARLVLPLRPPPLCPRACLRTGLPCSFSGCHNISGGPQLCHVDGRGLPQLGATDPGWLQFALPHRSVHTSHYSELLKVMRTSSGDTFPLFAAAMHTQIMSVTMAITSARNLLVVTLGQAVEHGDGLTIKTFLSNFNHHVIIPWCTGVRPSVIDSLPSGV